MSGYLWSPWKPPKSHLLLPQGKDCLTLPHFLLTPFSPKTTWCLSPAAFISHPSGRVCALHIGPNLSLHHLPHCPWDPFFTNVEDFSRLILPLNTTSQWPKALCFPVISISKSWNSFLVVRHSNVTSALLRPLPYPTYTHTCCLFSLKPRQPDCHHHITWNCVLYGQFSSALSSHPAVLSL